MKDLFDAIVERDKAIESVTANAHEAFHESARAAILYLLGSKEVFSADDIWETIEKLFPIKGYSSDPRALGGVLRLMQKEKFIKPTGQWVPSRRRHAAPIMSWSSS